MKVIVCGSIGYGGMEEIQKLQSFLRKNGYEVLDQLTVDYSDVSDFRDKPDLCEKIVKNDLDFCEKADVIIFITTNPSFGAMAEVLISSMKGKPIIVYCPKEVRSPWPLYFATIITKNENELLEALKSIKSIKINTIPNIYGEHETELIYEKFTHICPVTKIRDYGTIKIRYKPKDKLIEYESLDKYFKEFENKEIHHEAVICKIFNDLLDAIKPEKLEVIGDFEERSNVKAIVKCSYQVEKNNQSNNK